MDAVSTPNLVSIARCLTATFLSLQDAWINGDLPELTRGTVTRMFYGWLLASVFGIVLGTLIGVSATMRAWLQPSFEFIRPLPASALVPVAIALFGLSPAMVLFVITFGAIWPVLLGTIHGFASIEPRLNEVSRVLGLSRFAFIVKIGLPNALVDALAGMRISLTISLILAVVGEMLTSQSGLGTAILLAARSFRAADLFAGVLLLGGIGLGSNFLLYLLEQRLLIWKR
ncbi:sulfonate transport system permease protein [Undibacterium sp. GrIS 1.8]|uniref:ABC transporter permease n=1 Tax=Undibacterium sp. GrIS 1.8 TaxID=3143934 RepID=UPI0033932308